jgi:hypothetical protein
MRVHCLKIRVMLLLYAQQKFDTLTDEEDPYNVTG